jgi:hypothetical protein
VKFMYFCVEKLILNDREIYALEDVLSKGTWNCKYLKNKSLWKAVNGEIQATVPWKSGGSVTTVDETMRWGWVQPSRYNIGERKKKWNGKRELVRLHAIGIKEVLAQLRVRHPPSRELPNQNKRTELVWLASFYSWGTSTISRIIHFRGFLVYIVPWQQQLIISDRSSSQHTYRACSSRRRRSSQRPQFFLFWRNQ